MSVCFLNFIPGSHIYRDMAVAAFLSGLHGWMFGSLGWSSGPAKLVGWPLHLKSGPAAVPCTCLTQSCLQAQVCFYYFVWRWVSNNLHWIRNIKIRRLQWGEGIPSSPGQGFSVKLGSTQWQWVPSPQKKALHPQKFHNCRKHVCRCGKLLTLKKKVNTKRPTITKFNPQVGHTMNNQI